MKAIITKEDRQKRLAQIDREYYKNLVSSYEKAKREGNLSKVNAIAQVRHDLYGEGDVRSPQDYGNIIE